MRFRDLKRQVEAPIFHDYQVARLFTDEPKNQINIQLSRLVKRGDLVRLKRGVFAFPGSHQHFFYPRSRVFLVSGQTRVPAIEVGAEIVGFG